MIQLLFTAPDEYLGVLVPGDIKRAWRAWQGADWRLAQHYNRGWFTPPDQRFGLVLPEGVCAVHRRMWREWRDRRFNGIRFPGFPAGDGFCNARTEDGIVEDWERARAEWDEMTREQMRAVEDLCLSGRSVQCEGPRIGVPADDVKEVA